jgi:hypothetical protein
MILRDEHGEIDVKVGDLFEVEDAKFSVICPELSGEVDSFRNISVWVRLLSGKINLPDGRRVEVNSPDDQGQPFLFSGTLLATCVRNYRRTPVPSAIQPQSESRRAPATKKREKQHRPTSESLF